MTELYKLGVKVFADNGADLELARFIPIFQRWIQQQSVPGHLLIDVHDYSHVPNGPGILLVAHEGNFSTDSGVGGDRLGLFYYRKQPVEGDLATKLDQIIKIVTNACRQLESEPGLDGLKFRSDELLVVTNDRLLSPNDPATAAHFKSAVGQAVGANAVVTLASADPRERLSVHVRHNR